MGQTTRLIYWNESADGWYDVETDVSVKNMDAPDTDEPLQPKQPPQWMALLDERTQKHILFARVYRAEFGHGAPGHLDLMTIATLAQLLDNFEHHGSHLPQVSFTK